MRNYILSIAYAHTLRDIWVFSAIVSACLAFQPWAEAQGADDLHHVHISGQSLSLGYGGELALSITASANHLMFSGGLLTPEMSSLVPLRAEGSETIAHGMAEGVTNMLEDAGQPADHDMLMSISGRGGTVINDLDWQGGDPYHVFWTAMFSFWRGSLYAAEDARNYVPTAIAWLQGETDLFVNTDYASYKDSLLKLQLAYRFGSEYMTGITSRMPMFTYQTNVMTIDGEARSDVPVAQHHASEESSNIYLVAPIYALEYADGLHLTSDSYRHLGGYFAKAYKKVIVDGGDWQPLKPLQVTLQAKLLTVDFQVPTPPLVLDTDTVTDPGDYGFEVYDQLGRLPIEEVRLAGDSQLEIVLARKPVGGGQLRYAHAGPELGEYLWHNTGKFAGARGNLRDSDSTTGFDLNQAGEPYALPNWCIVFAMDF